jgi:hypothetical protein
MAMPSESPDSSPCHQLNVPSDSQAEKYTQEFITLLSEEREKGYGFVPLIGAGLSAPSGIPIITELKLYLQRCVGLALGADVLDADDRRRRWNPRKDHWPPLSDPRRPQDIDWFLKVYEEWQMRKRTPTWDPELSVFQEALGALAEWRTALHFLSRLDSDVKGPDKRDVLYLNSPDRDVIDAFFLHVTSGKRPTLGHRMVAHLSTVLRIHTLLTINFDELLEQAFDQIGRRLTTYDVHLNSGLPPLSALRVTPSLIKMHGGRYSLRGDYSLDTPPSEEDRKQFISYLTGQLNNSDRSQSGSESDCEEEQVAAKNAGTGQAEATKQVPFQNHLLVMGCSVSERRVTGLIKEAWRRIPAPFCVFWVCYRPEEMQAVANLALEALAEGPHPVRCHVLRHTDLGLLFLDVFQVLAEGLPDSGIVFPSLSRLAIPPIPVEPQADVAAKKSDSTGPRATPAARKPDGHSLRSENLAMHRLVERNRATDQLRQRVQAVQDRNFSGHRLIIATTAVTDNSVAENGKKGQPVSGITTIAAQVFGELQAQGQDCLWLDMNDISSTNDMFEQLLDAVCYRAGVEDWMPVYLEQELRPRVAEVNRITFATGRNWVIFMNARETPASNFDNAEMRLLHLDNRKHPNAWIDAKASEAAVEDPKNLDSDSEEPTASMESFLNLLLELCGRDCPNVSVVLLCRPAAERCQGVLARLRELGSPPNSGFGPATWIELKTSCVAYDVHAAVKWVIASFVKNDPVKQRFLHVMVLMQRTRYLATFFGTLFDDQPSESFSFEIINQWLDELEQHNIVRRKSGGFIWFHAPIRERLRILLEIDPTGIPNVLKVPSNVKKILTKWQAHQKTASIHQDLIEWYCQVFLASHSPGAIFEAVHHACEAALASIPANGSADVESIRRADCVLLRAEYLLRQSAAVIRTRGFSRGSCRRLKFLLEKLNELSKNLDATRSANTAGPQDEVALESIEAVHLTVVLLRKRCVIVMRGIAREVAEHNTAYARHRQLCELVVCGKIELTKNQTETKALSEKISFCPNKPQISILEGLETWASGQHYGLEYDRSESSDRQPLWVRWWRWTGILGKASRSYSNSESALIRALTALTGPLSPAETTAIRFISKGPPGVGDLEAQTLASAREQIKPFVEFLDRVAANLAKVRPVALGVFCTAPQELRIEIVKVLEQYLQLMLLEEHVVKRQLKTPADPIFALAAKECFEHACKILRQVEYADDPNSEYPSHDSVWLRVRLLTHRSIIDARENGGGVNAHRSLNEAEATLHLVDRFRQSVSWAIISLHRAEVAIENARTTSVPLDESVAPATPTVKDVEFKEYVRRLRSLGDSHESEVVQAEISKMSKTSDHWRGVLAILKDATMCLNQAETILMTRRKNVWWATWYFQRRLKVVEFELWATVGERHGLPIPYIGLEAASRRTMTLPDELLENACRMVRLDVYRLATVIETYAYCMWAVHLRLLGDPCAERLPRRQNEMREKVKKALDYLMQVNDKRKVAELPRAHTIHWEVNQYVEQVVKTVETILRKTRNPIQ